MHFKNLVVGFKIRKKNGLKFEFETLQRYSNGKKGTFLNPTTFATKY